MDKIKEFISPKFSGKRFEDHTLPLEFLEDLASFEDLVIKLAKKFYYNENPDRERVPKGFNEDITLKLSSIDEGSTIPKIVLVIATGIASMQNVKYFEKAKECIIETLDSSASGRNSINSLPQEFYTYFNQIGKHLRDDEEIDFSPNSVYKARLNPTIRQKLIEISNINTEQEKEFSLRAMVSEIDKGKKSYTLELVTGEKIVSQIDQIFLDDIISAFNNYEKGQKVLINGIGKYKNDDKLESIVKIESFELVNNLNIQSRLADISSLKDGWLNGAGLAPNSKFIADFSDKYNNYYDATSIEPFVFPTPSGGLQLEWSINENEISLKIDPNSFYGQFHLLVLENDDEATNLLDLNKAEDWVWLNDQIKKLRIDNI